jgi:hypothetical protein
MTARGQARNAYPAMRIFVFGQEVSIDTHTCTVNWADDTRAPSTASFTISDKPSGTGGPTSRYIMRPTDTLALFPQINPTTVQLPDVKQILANDPSLEEFRVAFMLNQTREGQLAFLQTFTGSTEAAKQILARGESVLQRFAHDTYLPAIASAETDIKTQVRESLRTIPDDVKRKVLAAKFDKTSRVAQPDLHETGDKAIDDVRRATYLKGEAARYPLWTGRPIFHTNDPVRIFWRDPFAPRAWYHMFAGFISDWTINRTTGGEETITFVCEDVLRLLRYARITTNPGVFDIAQLRQVEDLVTRTFFNDDFTGLTLSELLYTVLFGPEIPDTSSLLRTQGNIDASTVRKRGADDLRYVRYAANGGVSEQRVPPFGVGAFNFQRSVTFIFGPTTDAPQAADNESETPVRLLQREVRLTGDDALGVYQSVVDHQVRVSDLEALLLEGETPTPRSAYPRDAMTGEPTVESIITEIGENPHRYPVDAGRLIILAPASLGPNVNRSILEKDFRGPETQTTFKNRLFVLLNILQRIEFSFYATPRGDIVAEMPLYDFDPDDFGLNEVTYGAAEAATAETPASSGARARVLEAAAKNPSGPYGLHYRIAKRDTMDSNQTLTDEKVRTQMKVAWAAIQNLRSAGYSAEVLGQSEVVTIRSLVPQFGVRDEQQEPPVYIASPEAAQVYGHLKLNQINAEALTAQVDMLPQLRIGPNRPLELEDGTYIATARSASRTLDWAGRDMTQTIGVNYTRVWDGLTDENHDPIYAPIGGAASRTMNYAALFRRRAADAPSAMPRGTPPGLETG